MVLSLGLQQQQQGAKRGVVELCCPSQALQPTQSGL